VNRHGSSLRVAVVGSGPAGFYAADQLLKAGVRVYVYELLPTPFGLVRAGVAPDHPKIKSVVRVFERTAGDPRFRFFGGVEVGEDVTCDDLAARYHGIVYAVGTPESNRMGVPGEGHAGSHGATEFVAWYNGHPDHADHRFDLSVQHAVVVGNGNVAIDAARMLMLDPEEIAATDTADHAVAALASARVREVTLLGRRGPAQAAFTYPELRELGELRRADVAVDESDLVLDPASAEWLASGACDPGTRRIVELLREYAQRAPAADKSHRIKLKFLRSPLEILGDGDDRVRGIRVARNRIEGTAAGTVRAVATGEQEEIDCGLVLRAIGYRGRPLPGVPFDARRGLIPNAGGRVTTEEGETLLGQYVVGWIKRGPSGVIGTNKKDATETVARIVEDVDAGRLRARLETDAGEIEAWLRSAVPGLVSWTGWTAIDAHERMLGEPHGRPRVKLVHVREMLDVAGQGAN
jgi:ferredoxin--NADP+ reductase